MTPFTLLPTPTGPFALLRTGAGWRTEWVRGADDPRLAGASADGTAPELATRVARYFDGDIVDFDDVPLLPGPPFFRACWAACRLIPRGTVISYGELARRAGSASSARAAGQAMRRNPQPIITPCHRVTRSGGDLGGFSGSTDPRSDELCRKRWLLTMEGALAHADTAREHSLFSNLPRTGRS